MIDEIVAHLKNTPTGVPPERIARDFLKFKNPDGPPAALAVAGLLSKDPRCSRGDDGLWRYSGVEPEKKPALLADLPLVAVYCLRREDGSRKIAHVSAWKVYPAPSLLLSRWTCARGEVSHEESAVLVGEEDRFADESGSGLRSVEFPNNAVAVFAAYDQQSAFVEQFPGGDALVDDEGFVVGRLMRAAGVRKPHPFSLERACERVLGFVPLLGRASLHGRALAELVDGLVELLRRQGIDTVEQLEQREEELTAAFDFSGKSFSFADISSLPRTSGVYAFKDKEDRFLYIGQSRNLRRRVAGYFQDNGESPEKIGRIRDESHELITYPCGSDLESALYEYRLIRKYRPLLNSQRDIAERKGTYRAIPDSVIILPHAKPEMVMTVWYRRGQKVKLKSLPADSGGHEGLREELERFFFSGPLQATPSDFPEQEIVDRWVRRRHSFPAVNVADCGSAAEALRQLRGRLTDTVS